MPMSIELGSDIRGKTLRVRAWVVVGILVADVFCKDYATAETTERIVADLVTWLETGGLKV